MIRESMYHGIPGHIYSATLQVSESELSWLSRRVEEEGVPPKKSSDPR